MHHQVHYAGIEFDVKCAPAVGRPPPEDQATTGAQSCQTNFTSAVGWCLAAASVLERQRAGSLLVIGSVAGDRGRQSNFVYGATKGGLGRLVEGVAHKLAPLGARAVLIKPGFVDTPMTANVPNRRGPLWARVQDIAPLIAAAARRGGPVLYVPRVWWAIMLVVRNLPTCLFNRLRI